MSNTESPHLTVDDLAVRWKTNRKGIYNLRHRRRLPPAIRQGNEKRGRLLWPLAAIEAHERESLATDPKRPDAPEMRPAESAAA